MGDASWGDDLRGTYTYLMSIPKPIIAAINGPIAGMAVPIALACDLRFMARDAVLTVAFSQRGLIGEWGSSWLLPRLVGTGVALDLLFSSRKVDGAECERVGLVNRAVDGSVVDAARDYIVDLAAHCSPTSLAVMKRQVYQQLHAGLGPAEREAQALMRRELRDGPTSPKGSSRSSRNVRLRSADSRSADRTSRQRPSVILGEVSTTHDDVALAELYAGFASTGLMPLWTARDDLMPMAPKPSARPHVWRWSDVRPLAARAGDLVPVGRGGERRAIAYANPGHGRRPVRAHRRCGPRSSTSARTRSHPRTDIRRARSASCSKAKACGRWSTGIRWRCAAVTSC